MNKQEWKLQQHWIALCDLLKITGLAPSGGAAKQAIAAGQVRRNGAVEYRKTAKIHAGEVIEYQAQQIMVTASDCRELS